MGEALEKIGGSVMNLVLGALIVWVGQTTFQHAGILAGVDEKFATIDKQFQDGDKRHESMRKWLETVVTDMKDNNRSQFTAKEGDKLVGTDSTGGSGDDRLGAEVRPTTERVGTAGRCAADVGAEFAAGGGTAGGGGAVAVRDDASGGDA